MNVLPVSNENYSPNFGAKLMLKGQYSNAIKEAFMNNKALKELSSDSYDVVGKVSHKRSSYYEQVYKGKSQDLYKVNLKILESDFPPIFNKIINILSSYVPLTKNYHSEDTIIHILEKGLNSKVLSEKMGLTKLQ